MTAEPAVRVVCPPWCVVPPEAHLAALASWEGKCIHHGPSVDVGTSDGDCSGIDVSVSSMTWPSGMVVDGEVPFIWIDGGSHTVEQVRALIVALQEAADLLS